MTTRPARRWRLAALAATVVAAGAGLAPAAPAFAGGPFSATWAWDTSTPGVQAVVNIDIAASAGAPTITGGSLLIHPTAGNWLFAADSLPTSGGWTCALTPADDLACASIPDLAPGSPLNLDVVVDIDPSAATGDPFDADITLTDSTGADVLTGPLSTITVDAPVTSLEPTVNLDTITLGATPTLTVGLDNAGPSEDPGPITFTITTPTGLGAAHNRTVTLDLTGLPECSLTTAPNVYTCVYPDGMSLGASPDFYTFPAAGPLPTDTPAGTTVTATVTVSSASNTPTVSTGTYTATSQGPAYLIAAGPGPNVPGQSRTQTITVTNTGTTSDPGPLTVDIVAHNQTSTVAPYPPGCFAAAPVGGRDHTTCTIAGPIAAGQAVTVQLDLLLDADAVPASVLSGGTVTASSARASSTVNQTGATVATTSIHVGYDGQLPTVSGGSSQVTLTFTNQGPASIPNPLISFPVDAPLTVDLPAGCVHASSVVACAGDTALAAGESVSWTVRFSTAVGTPVGTVLGAVTVTGTGGSSTAGVVTVPGVTVVSVAPPAVAGFTPFTPQRRLDTRAPNELGIGTLTGNRAVQVPFFGFAGIPSSATAVSLNVTAVGRAGGQGWVAVYPCAAGYQGVSTTNWAGSTPSPNAATVALDSAGLLCVIGNAAVDVVIDVNGYHSPDGAVQLSPVTPTRVADTRSGQGGRVHAGETRVFELGAPAGVSAATLNVTATDALNAGFVTVWPCSAGQPLASNLNQAAGVARPNQVVTAVSDGRVCVYSSSDVDLVIDVAGWWQSAAPGGLAFTAVSPARLLDTRVAGRRIGAGETFRLDVSGLDPVAAAAQVNVTSTGSLADGFVTVWACELERPLASMANPRAGADVPNAATVQIGGSRSLCIYSHQGTDLVIDVTGVFSPATT